MNYLDTDVSTKDTWEKDPDGARVYTGNASELAMTLNHLATVETK